MIGGRREKCCKRWWSANPITLSQIWLPPSPVPPVLVHHQSFQGLYMSISPCTHVYANVYVRMCPADTVNQTLPDDDRLENWIRHFGGLSPPLISAQFRERNRPRVSFEGTAVKWKLAEGRKDERFFAGSTINYTSVARVNFVDSSEGFVEKNFVAFRA